MPFTVTNILSIKMKTLGQTASRFWYNESAGDRRLPYWRELHEDLFSKWLEEVGLHFSQDSLVVLEEFRVVYPID